ncbi:MAG: coenzyme F420-0:L-glutamate ligase [Bacillota bacterium]
MKVEINGDVGVVAVGIKTGLILPDDDIGDIALASVADVVEDGDIICVTESVVARSQNRYLTCEELADDIRQKLSLRPGATLAVISPIVSRNRFALILRAIARATDRGRVIIQLAIPDDEVGNQVLDRDVATTRLRLKRIFDRLQEIRGNTPHMNVLIREVLAALKLQEIGYRVIGIRKITGQGMADVTVRDPDGRVISVEVGFGDLESTAKKALGIMRDADTDGAFAVAVDLQGHRIAMADAVACRDGSLKDAMVAEMNFTEQLSVYRDPDCLYFDELSNLSFSHPITGMDYPRLYRDVVTAQDAEVDILFTNNPLKVFDRGFVDGIVIGAVHERHELKDLFLSFGTQTPLVTIQEIGPEPWGVIGSNVSHNEKGILKLLPDNPDETADDIKQKILSETGRSVEVLIFGDGAYKDPDTGIYELADPHPAIGCSSGLRGASLRTGTKLKLQVETLFRAGHSREEIRRILDSGEDVVSRESLGTTPRSVTAILGTLADLTAGSADAGTPIVLVRNFSF